MTTQPCPNRDKGTCAIPDRTLVVSDGAVSVRSREEIEAEFPSIDLSQSSLLEVAGTAESLLEAVEAFEHAFAGDAGRHTMVVQLESNWARGTYVIVDCRPCGCTFKTRV